jgi:hypothetical protein
MSALHQKQARTKQEERFAEGCARRKQSTILFLTNLPTCSVLQSNCALST